ncbi:MAG: hypothetical protein LBH29_00215 [Elusimicrobiota bacterium]|nr:hypothetical protein [Elusimicrobiota bacterium]
MTPAGKCGTKFDLSAQICLSEKCWRGVAWRGVAWRGVAWRGVAWRRYVITHNSALITI